MKRGHFKGVAIQLPVMFLCLWSGKGVLTTRKRSGWIGGHYQAYKLVVGAILVEWTPGWEYLLITDPGYRRILSSVGSCLPFKQERKTLLSSFVWLGVTIPSTHLFHSISAMNCHISESKFQPHCADPSLSFITHFIHLRWYLALRANLRTASRYLTKVAPLVSS